MGTKGFIKRMKRGKHAPRAYRSQARHQCSGRVVRKSVYVEVAPKHQTCSACIYHAFVVHRRSDDWKVWTSF
jgi:hypothetical protein